MHRSLPDRVCLKNRYRLPPFVVPRRELCGVCGMATVIPLPYQSAHAGDDHTTTVIRRFMYAVCIAAVLATLGIMLYASDGAMDAFGWTMLAAGSTPYIALIVLDHWYHTRACAIILLISSLLIGGFGVYAQVDAFFIHVHSTSALVYLFLPVDQWIGVAIAG
jgi:hypothetical protein